jgi:Pyruvate/2-oxoacid:ferredoxin oxidoreductase delta subunit
MKRTFPTATYAFRYRTAPVSGNDINGLGERSRRRARQIFHGSGRRRLEWQRLQTFFALTMPFRIYWQGICNYWLLRKADGRVAKRKVRDDPAALAEKIKAFAMDAGAGGVGICRVTEEALYEDYDPGFPNAISIMMPMNLEEMRYIPEPRAALEVMKVYFAISRVAVDVAAAVRAMGWRARAYGESADILHIPLAVAAGLGELGKHGSLISKAFGSNVRLATVLTDMPLAADTPVDIGVEDLCLSCRRCTVDCPADAIVDHKQLVRGEEKWYVDFDRCVPYFSKTLGCGICIEVCPWTKPDRGESLSQKLLAKRAVRRSRAGQAGAR